MTRIFPLLALAACTPELHSVGDDTGGWLAPENTWPVGDRDPSGLVGAGFNAGQVIPEVRLVDQHGDTVSLWQFYGMVIAVDVSTLWCGPCAALADEVDATWHDYDDQGFIYVTLLPENKVGATPTAEDLDWWADEHAITAPILGDDQGWSYQIEPNGSYPHVMIVGRDMTVQVDSVQPAEDASIRAAIEAAL